MDIPRQLLLPRGVLLMWVNVAWLSMMNDSLTGIYSFQHARLDNVVRWYSVDRLGSCCSMSWCEAAEQVEQPSTEEWITVKISLWLIQVQRLPPSSALEGYHLHRDDQLWWAAQQDQASEGNNRLCMWLCQCQLLRSYSLQECSPCIHLSPTKHSLVSIQDSQLASMVSRQDLHLEGKMVDFRFNYVTIVHSTFLFSECYLTIFVGAIRHSATGEVRAQRDNIDHCLHIALGWQGL